MIRPSLWCIPHLSQNYSHSTDFPIMTSVNPPLAWSYRNENHSHSGKWHLNDISCDEFLPTLVCHWTQQVNIWTDLADFQRWTALLSYPPVLLIPWPSVQQNLTYYITSEHPINLKTPITKQIRIWHSTCYICSQTKGTDTPLDWTETLLAPKPL